MVNGMAECKLGIMRELLADGPRLLACPYQPLSYIKNKGPEGFDGRKTIEGFVNTSLEISLIHIWQNI
jgi:hypothetical protein